MQAHQKKHSRLRSKFAVVCLTSLISGTGCREILVDGDDAPFSAKLGQVTFDVPQRDDLYQAYQSEDGKLVRIRVCNRERFYQTYEQAVPSCEGMAKPLVNLYGVSTYLRHFEGDQYRLLSERPASPTPPPNPLVEIPGHLINRQLGRGTEGYQLSRVMGLGGRLYTTDRDWPVAACHTAPQGHRYCIIGFLVRDVFVEAHWHAEDGVQLNQAEVWSVAVALDAKIRSLIATQSS